MSRWFPPPASVPEITWRSAGWGILFCIIFTIASAYSGLKVGQVMEAAIPISILTIGLARIYRRRSTRAGECHHHRHRRRFRQRRCRRDLHAPCALHSQARSASGSDDLHLHRRRLPGSAFPDSPAPLFCPRNAWAVPLSGSHGDHRSPGDRRKRRIAGAPAAGGYGPMPAFTISS